MPERLDTYDLSRVVDIMGNDDDQTDVHGLVNIAMRGAFRSRTGSKKRAFRQTKLSFWKQNKNRGQNVRIPIQVIRIYEDAR